MSVEKKQRYHLFAGDNYYPYGGAGDYKGTSESIDELHRIYDEMISKRIGTRDVWGQICNAETMEVIEDL